MEQGVLHHTGLEGRESRLRLLVRLVLSELDPLLHVLLEVLVVLVVVGDVLLDVLREGPERDEVLLARWLGPVPKSLSLAWVDAPHPVAHHEAEQLDLLLAPLALGELELDVLRLGCLEEQLAMTNVPLQDVLLRVVVVRNRGDVDVVNEDARELLAVGVTKLAEGAVHQRLEDPWPLLRPEVQHQWLEEPPASSEREQVRRSLRDAALREAPDAVERALQSRLLSAPKNTICLRARPRTVQRLAVDIAVVPHRPAKKVLAGAVDDEGRRRPRGALTGSCPPRLAQADLLVFVELQPHLIELREVERLLDARNSIWLGLDVHDKAINRRCPAPLKPEDHRESTHHLVHERRPLLLAEVLADVALSDLLASVLELRAVLVRVNDTLVQVLALLLDLRLELREELALPLLLANRAVASLEERLRRRTANAAADLSLS